MKDRPGPSRQGAAYEIDVGTFELVDNMRQDLDQIIGREHKLVVI